MIKISLPCTIKLGPGVNTFGLAVNKKIFLEFEEVEVNDDKTGFIIEKTLENKELYDEVCFLADKVYKHSKKSYSLDSFCIKVRIQHDDVFHEYLNYRSSLLLGFIKMIDIALGLSMDEDKLLKFYKKIDNSVECATACLMGSLSVVDREKKIFLNIQWPENWRIGIIKSVKNKVCKLKNVKLDHNLYHDSVGKSAIFICAVQNRQKGLLFSSFQDAVSYKSTIGNVPFLEKINLIGKSSGVCGFGFLKKDPGILIIGEENNLDNCIKRIMDIYNRNNLEYVNSVFLPDSRGIEICQ